MRVIAAGILTGTGTPAWTGTRVGFTATVTDNGTGDWSVALDPDVASIVAVTTGGYVILATVLGATPLCATVEVVSATALRIRAMNFDATPAPADGVVAIAIWKLAA